VPTAKTFPDESTAMSTGSSERHTSGTSGHLVTKEYYSPASATKRQKLSTHAPAINAANLEIFFVLMVLFLLFGLGIA